MKNCIYALLLTSVLAVNDLCADEIEEVIVTSSLIDQTLSELENPLHVISGDDISNGATQSLGESLDNLLGVSSTDYGSGVGQPIIRGMSGSRVRILNNGMVVRDVSGLGSDHINDIDMNNIQQVEVVIGPSSLLYSNGSIGGIINIVDNTIARNDFLESELRLGLEGQSVNNGNAHHISFQNNIAGLNLSFAYKNSQFDNFDVPIGAILHDEEIHEGGLGEAEEAHEEDVDYLANSDYETSSRRLGVSKAGDWGYFGLSINYIESLYGIPFHGEVYERESEDDEEHEGERIFSTTDSDVFNLEGSYVLKNRWIQKINYHFRSSDYSLTEQHAEDEEAHKGEFLEDKHHEIGPTLFKNDAMEYGAIVDLTNDAIAQKVAFNFAEENIFVMGAEASMNPAENEEFTLGYYLSNDFEMFHFDLGLRHDRIRRKGSVNHEGENPEDVEYSDRNIDNTSFAMSFNRDVDDSLEVNLGISSLERAPSSVALFMNGPHLATRRFEVGNANLGSERSNNIDLTFDYEKNGLFGAITFFKYDVDRYIYLQDQSEENQDEHHAGLALAKYVQQDAQLDGYELEFGKVIALARGSLSFSFGRDSVTGEFKTGNKIPRMVPARNIYSISYFESDFEIKLDLKDVEKQEDVGLNETPTGGYRMLDLKLSRAINFDATTELSISLFATNLFDEIARNHTSFVKDDVPLPGTNYGMNFNLIF